MAISVNEARQVTLHCREGAAATPLYPVTSADVVAYRNGSAGFTGETTRAALDELFRRLGVVEGEVLPPVIAVPELLSPEAETLVAEGEELTLTSTPFAMSSGRDTHTASEWRITGADGRQLWSSGESADRLESFPGLVVNRETLPGVTGVPDGEGLTVTACPSFNFLFGNYDAKRLKSVEGGVLLCWESGSQDVALRMVTRSADGGRLWERTACTDSTVFSDIVWTGTRFLAFPRATTSTSPVMASTDRGDTWTQAGSLSFKNQYCAVRAAALGGVLVAVTRTTTLHRSEDDGATWNAVTCPIAAEDIMTAHGHFVARDGSSWAASADGQNWFKIAALEGMTAVTVDDVGLVGTSLQNERVSLVRVSGENLQTTDTPKKSFGFADGLTSSSKCSLVHDAASGLYVLALAFSSTTPALWYGTALPESAESTPLLADAGWMPLLLGEFLPGEPSLRSVQTMSFAGKDYFLCKMEGNTDAGWSWHNNIIMGLRADMVGKLLSEQLLASVRHKGERAGWSDWAADIPFTAELGTGSAAGPEGLEQQNGVTFCTRGGTTYGAVLNTEFTVPEGVTELLVLCASGVRSATQPGRAASCRVSVTPGQVIPVSVGGYDSSGKTIITTSSFGSFIACDPSTGITCPSGTLMEFLGAAGYSTTRKGGGLAFLTDDEWRNFALHGTDQQPTAATSTADGLHVGWNGFTYMHSFCGGYSSTNGQSGIIKVWWGQQIAG